MKEIPLTRGFSALVDDDDYQEVSKYSWFAHVGKWCTYAARCELGEDGRHHTIRMHRVIAKTPDGCFTDHRNGNTLDNRKENLRIATKQQNGQNRSKIKKTSSQFKGVGKTLFGKWRARIAVNKHLIEIGTFNSEIEAAIAYDAKAREFYGEWARPNFPITPSEVRL